MNDVNEQTIHPAYNKCGHQTHIKTHTLTSLNSIIHQFVFLLLLFLNSQQRHILAIIIEKTFYIKLTAINHSIFKINISYA